MPILDALASLEKDRIPKDFASLDQEKEIRAGEENVGILSDRLLSLRAYMWLESQKLVKMNAAVHNTTDKTAQVRKFHEYLEFACYLSRLRDLFRFAVREQFRDKIPPDWHFGIRRGFVVVKFKQYPSEPERKSILDFLLQD